MTDTRRRVKLYALNIDRQWDDKGTGHVFSSYVESLKGVSLLVRAESDGSLLLESKIEPDTTYQKQQETLIVWSERDNYDLALSFQERAGCDEIWAKICQVQGKDPSLNVTQDTGEEEDERFEETPETSDIVVELPPCEIDKLDELNELIASCLPFPIKRERLAFALETENYIKKLLNLFHTCEDHHNVKALHKLHDIFKNVFLLNKNPLFEVMLGEEALFDVIGIFEYDPSLAQPKKHREYLKSVSRFKEVIPFGNAELINKIHQTYRVQYIQDVVLPTPSLFEESITTTLSSLIFFNKVEIVSLIQDDDKFLRELFAQVTDDATDEERRKDLVLFLKEFCTFSQTLQPQNRESFFKALSTLGVLQTLEVILTMEDPLIRSAAVDILTYVVEYSPSMVREYALQQARNFDLEDQYIINIMIEQMICDPDPDLGMAVQLSSILRLLIDPENMVQISGASKSEKFDFFNFFYKHCMNVLVAPVLANTTEDKPTKEDGQLAQLLSIILEILSFCVEHHSYHIKNFVLYHDLVRRILVLMMSKHTFLVLSALRFLRKIIGLKDEFYNNHIIARNLFAPVVEVFKQNNGRYNLLDSAIIELFEFIKTESIKSLCVHIVDKFGKYLDKIEYVKTFQILRSQYEELKDRLNNDRGSLESSSVLRENRYRKDPRQLDDDEEMWFNTDDDDDITSNLSESMNYKLDAEFDQLNKKITDRKSNIGLSYADQENVKKYNDLENVKSIPLSNRGASPRRTLPLASSNQSSPSLHVEVQSRRKGGLVDYPDEDSDEEENEEESNLNHTKRARISS